MTAMPQDLAISVAAKPGTDVLLSADQGERKHPMRGYDDTYVDIVDFVIRVTHRIWEEKDIGHIYDTYRHNARVTDDYGLQYGRDKITWNWRNLSTIDRAYAPNVRWMGPTDRRLQGRGDLKSFVLSMLATFPDLAVSVDDVYWMGNEADGYLVSVRWSALGTHRGHGVYGAPTGRRVALWGISQHRIEQGRIAQEWTLFNEFEVLQQILRDEPVAGAA